MSAPLTVSTASQSCSCGCLEDGTYLAPPELLESGDFSCGDNTDVSLEGYEEGGKLWDSYYEFDICIFV